MSEHCIFCKIVRHELPAKIVYEDEDCLVFHDINPAAPVHLLMIPKRHIVSMQEINPEDSVWLGRMLSKVPQIALDNGCNPGPSGGFRLMTNSGVEGGQEVLHLHFHIYGGSRPWKGPAPTVA
ncbi:histidine triad nucleotide-binding protein [Zwartia sp.]|uniref:histidine triad nucleotide-binding protein n=1 Tax=Zwartia sp. TaxID=2978004 RepID=UPI003BB0E8EE